MVFGSFGIKIYCLHFDMCVDISDNFKIQKRSNKKYFDFSENSNLAFAYAFLKELLKSQKRLFFINF